jgi:hypothetical protein
MRRICPALLVIGAAAAAVLGLFPARPVSRTPAAEPPPGQGTPPPVCRLQGVGSCAATGCHGGNQPKGPRGGIEYTTWVTTDPHARAYQALYGERSQHIQEVLTGKHEPATQNALCLQCHTSDPALVAPDQRYLLADGIGCESCHGAAEKWRPLHYLADWKTRTDKELLGFRPIKDLTARARTCVPCHVGAPEREVNHDLIAAGHPRLRFEFGAYLANYPRHWSETNDKTGRPDFEARAWAIGQVVSAQAALGLLASRARDQNKAWPEFAEYGCFSCHHSLQDRRPPPARGRKPGALPWGTWYFALLPQQSAAGEVKSREVLEGLMSRLPPNREEAAREAERSARALDGALAAAEKPSDGQALAARLATLAQEPAPGNWDHATQLYLGLAAVYQALGDLDGTYRERQPLRAAVQGIHDELDRAFLRGRESVYDSPRDYDPQALDQKIRALRDLVRPTPR